MEIIPQELKTNLDDNSIIIDVRTPAEYESIHIIGAINLPLDMISKETLEEIIKDKKKIFTICQSGKRGGIACSKITELGYNNVINISGGTLACKDAGIEVITGKKCISLERQVRIAAGTLVLLGVILSFLIPNLIYLSAFVGAGLVFSGVTDTCGMALILGKMPWNKSKVCGVK